MIFRRSRIIALKKKIFRDKNTSVFLLVAGLLSFIPLYLLLAMLIKNSVNVPFADQWSFIDIMAKEYYGSLTFHDLWAQHNEHRILVPKAIGLALGSVTDFNFRVPVVLNLAVSFSSFLLLVTLLRRTFTNPRIVALLSIITSWLMFSPFQSINWIWGFQLAFHLTVFFTILAIWFLTKRNAVLLPKVLGAAIIAAILGTYSVGTGLLIWPIGFMILLGRRVPRQQLMVWGAAGVIIIASYFYKFQRSAGSPAASEIITEPVVVAKYILIYLGRSLSTSPEAAQNTGLGLLVLFIISVALIYKKNLLNQVSSWIALAAFVILTSALAAASRLNFGHTHSYDAISYTTVSILFVIVTIVLSVYATNLWLEDFKKKNLGRYLATFFIIGAASVIPFQAYINNYSWGSNKIKEFNMHFHKVRECVFEATSANDECLLLVCPDKEVAWRQIQFLRESEWSEFK